MDRREFMSAGIPFAPMSSSEGSPIVKCAPWGSCVPESKPPLFADNAQFWYETRRAFGASATEQANLAKSGSACNSRRGRATLWE